jgi:hypothetical protein
MTNPTDINFEFETRYLEEGEPMFKKMGLTVWNNNDVDVLDRLFKFIREGLGRSSVYVQSEAIVVDAYGYRTAIPPAWMRSVLSDSGSRVLGVDSVLSDTEARESKVLESWSALTNDEYLVVIINGNSGGKLKDSAYSNIVKGYMQSTDTESCLETAVITFFNQDDGRVILECLNLSV